MKVYCSNCKYSFSGNWCFAPNIVSTPRRTKQQNEYALTKNENNDCPDFEPDDRSSFQKFLDEFRSTDDYA